MTDGVDMTMRVHSLIGGDEVAASDTFEDIDPSTGQPLASVARGGAVEIDQAIEAARQAQPRWGAVSAADRANALRGLASLIEGDRDQLALMESRDTGKPLAQAVADAKVAGRYFEYYANTLEAFFGRVIPTAPGVMAYTEPVPLGVTGHITAWNYPMQILCRTIAPAIAVGNAVVVKPAEEAPLTSTHIAKLVLEAGIPAGVVNVVHGFGEEAGAALAAHPGIDHLSFTGSVEVGSTVSKAAADNVTAVSLELGGKSPNIVMADADLDKAMPVIAKSVIQNAGQTCSAGSRLLIHQSLHDQAVAGLADIFGAVSMGPGPSDPDLGPLISATQLERVVGYAETAGAAAVGGKPPTDAELAGGYFFPATIFDDVDPDSRLAHEEVFGPVLAVIPFTSDDQAVEVANATEYGLIAAVWTQDLNTAHRIGGQIQAGQVYVNTFGAGGGVEFPFGGFKKSGYGREKGFEALAGFTQTRTTIIKLD